MFAVCLAVVILVVPNGFGMGYPLGLPSVIQPSEAIEPKKVGSGTSGVCSSWSNKMK